MLSKIVELFSNFSWTLLDFNPSLSWTISTSNYSQICCFSLRSFSRHSSLFFTSMIWLLSSLIKLSISFSSCSCFFLCSITKFLCCLYLFLYLFNSSKVLRSYASILTSSLLSKSYSFLFSSAILRKRTFFSSLSLDSFELLSSSLE